MPRGRSLWKLQYESGSKVPMKRSRCFLLFDPRNTREQPYGLWVRLFVDNGLELTLRTKKIGNFGRSLREVLVAEV
jgi:hypothetical protein